MWCRTALDTPRRSALPLWYLMLTASLMALVLRLAIVRIAPYEGPFEVPPVRAGLQRRIHAP